MGIKSKKVQSFHVPKAAGANLAGKKALLFQSAEYANRESGQVESLVM